MKKWITCEELCSHWDINIYDLTDLVSAGKLRPYHADDLSKIEFGNYDTFEKIEPGITGADPFTLTVDDVRKLVFRISDVEEYDKKNKITLQNISTEKPSSKQSHVELLDNQSNMKPRVALVHDEAKKLKRDCKDIDKVKALKRINLILQNNKYKPYSRTQFNRITEKYNFSPARRGRKSTKK